jgi:hypothetical protein
MTWRSITRIRLTVVVLALAGSAAALAAGKWEFTPSRAERRALASITPASLQAHLSFLSADPLEGRGAGTTGLDVAAEYVAAQFRRAGLKAIGDDGYFQVTPRIRLTPTTDGYQCRVSVAGRVLDVPSRQFALLTAAGGNAPAIRAIGIDDAPLVKVPFGGQFPEQTADAGRSAVITEIPAMPADQAERTAFLDRRRDFLTRLGAFKPALVVEVRRDSGRSIDYFVSRQLVDPALKGRAASGLPVVALFGDAAAAVFDALPAGPTPATISVRLASPVETDAPQRNVIGLLPGSDPKLGDTYVLVTAHYDGQGTRPGPDRVWNSANDNGSGTVSVIELASALAATGKHPRRSVVFIAFHGEESGLVGARFYAEHPAVPLEKTVAGINIEMVGRTDDTEGNQRKRASVTGFDYSDVGDVFRRAGEQTGVTVFKHPKNSDSYFGSSDNQALAAQGVPAHTVCVAFAYPDYHGAADTWQKIDYENMALTVRMIGTGVLTLAQSKDEPRWNPAVKGATRYLEAWKKRHPTEKR